MPDYEIEVSASLILTFDKEPTRGDVIAFLRREPKSLITTLEVDSIDLRE